MRHAQLRMRGNLTSLKIVYGNIFLFHSDADIWIFVEHRLPYAQLCKLARRLKKKHLRLHASSAQLKIKSESGGAMIISRSHLAVWPILGAALSPQPCPRSGVGDDWVAVVVKLHHVDVILGGVYLTTGLGVAGRNVSKLSEMASFAATRAEPILWFGDWNVTPDELVASGALRAFSPQRSMAPRVPDLPFTCTDGAGRILDFGLADARAAAVTSIPVKTQVPWGKHVGLSFTLLCKPRQVLARHLRRPARVSSAPFSHKEDVPVAMSWDAASQSSSRDCHGSMVRVRDALHEDREPPGLAAEVVRAPLLERVVDWREAASLGCAFERWGSTLDVWQCARHGIIPEKQHLYRGRLAAPAFVTRPVVPRRPKPDPPRCWPPSLVWGCLLSTAKAYRTARRAAASASFSLQGGVAARAWEHLSDADSVDKVKQIIVLVRLSMIDSLSLDVVDAVVSDIERVHAAFASTSRKAASQHSVTWAEKAIASPGAGAICRWLKEPTAVDPAGVLDPASKQWIHVPLDQAGARADVWSQQWTARQEIGAPFHRAFIELRARALEDVPFLDQLTGVDLKRAGHKVRLATGLGSDSILPEDFRALPMQAWDELAALLTSCEQKLIFPLQVLLQVMGCIPKADGSDRIIALVALVARAWSKCRCSVLGEWDYKRAGFWDSALAGHSALRAAAWRSLSDETMAWFGGTSATVWLDVAKFYDSLDPGLLISKLVDLEFPPCVLFMQLLLHWCPRIIASASCDSPVLHVSRSVLAGSEASNSMARGYLYDICERISSRIPSARLGTFVDDLVVRAEGTREQAVEACTEATAMCVVELNAALLDVAEKKSFCVGSTVAVARDVSARLRTRGVSVRTSIGQKDLGVDAGGGRVRRTQVQNARIATGTARTKRLGVLARILKRKAGGRRATVARLWKQAVAPASSFGVEVLGWAPSRLLRVRRLAAQACGFNGTGRCLTSAIAIGLGPDSDPAITMPCNVLFHWISMLHDPNFPLARVERAWGMCVRHMTDFPSLRWRRATGPMSTCIAVLLDARWIPCAAGLWVDRSGSLWGFDPLMPASREACTPLLDAFARDVRSDLWKAASSHRAGSAVMPGCTSLVRERVMRLASKGNTREAGVLRTAAAAGLWTAQRKFDCGYAASPACVLCGHSGDDEFHQCWECPAVLGHADMLELDDNALVAVALRQGRTALTRWTRCLCPDPAEDVPAPPETTAVVSMPDTSWPPALYFTDASGGVYSRTVPLRRVGFAAIQLPDPFLHDGRLVARPRRWLGGPVAGRQTVNRGETAAAIALLSQVQPVSGQWTTIVTDSRYLMRGAALPRPALMAGSNHDLWSAWHVQFQRHGERVALIKVAAHTSLDDVRAGVISLHDFWGNLIADRLAAQVTACHQLPQMHIDAFELARAVAAKLMRHVARAHSVAFDLRAALPEPDQASDLPRVSVPRLKVEVVAQSRHSTVFSNGHVAVPSGGGWRCSTCRLYRKSIAPTVWKMPCAAWTCAPRVSSFAATVAHAHGSLDEGDYDFDRACDDQADWADECLLEDQAPEIEMVVDDAMPVPASTSSASPRTHVVPAPSCVAPGQRVELALGAVGCYVRVGSSQVHASHSLRFTSQYVWCSACAGFTSGRHAKILHERCLADGRHHGREYGRGRLSRGLPPRPGMPALMDDVCGRIVVSVAGDGAVLSATQVPD